MKKLSSFSLGEISIPSTQARRRSIKDYKLYSRFQSSGLFEILQLCMHFVDPTFTCCNFLLQFVQVFVVG